MFAPGRAKDVQTKIYMCMFIQYKTRIAHSRDISGWTEIAHLPQETNTRVHMTA